MKEKTQEKRKYLVKAYLTEEEFQQVKKSSEQARLSLSTFVRNICVGYRVESKEDMQARHELIKGLADMGRLGGLYKLALSENKDTLQVRPLLRELELMQSKLKEKIRKL